MNAIARIQESYFAKQYGADRYARLRFYYMRPDGRMMHNVLPIQVYFVILSACSTLVSWLIASTPCVVVAIARLQESYFAKQYGADRYARLRFYYMRPDGRMVRYGLPITKTHRPPPAPYGKFFLLGTRKSPQKNNENIMYAIFIF